MQNLEKQYHIPVSYTHLTDAQADAALTVDNGDIRFDHVYFKYHPTAESWNLTDIDLHIESGMTVGILGGTGSAKTTLVSMIPRLYDCLLYTSCPRCR